MSESSIIYEVRGEIRTITLNRPQAMNAINRQVKAELRRVLAEFDEDTDARVAIITGAGKAFSAGRDLKERAADNQRGIQAQPIDSMSAHSLYSFPTPSKPVIAAVNGYCLAGGFSIAQMCDIRIASEEATFGITEPRVGLLGPFAVQLPRMIGIAHALELILTAEPVSAARAFEMGFVNRVVPHEQLLDEAMEVASSICKNAPLSVQYSKELAYRSLDLDDNNLLSLTQHLYRRLLESEDSREGPRAFADKRSPRWVGR